MRNIHFQKYFFSFLNITITFMKRITEAFLNITIKDLIKIEDIIIYI